MVPRRFRLAGAASLGLALAVGLVVWRRTAEFRLPRRMHLEHVVADLSEIEPGSVLRQGTAPIRIGGLQPNHDPRVNGAYRRAIVTPPPAALRLRRRMPPDALLRFGVAVDAPPGRDRGAEGIRFTVELDGREAYSRVVNPASHSHDRRWYDDAVDLGAFAGRDLAITLRTDPEGKGTRVVGTAGWSDVHLVQASWRERQPARPDAPNVLLVVVDTLRADQLGCYGATPTPSPTLDRLAAGGLLFRTAFSQAPWTMPSVASILTGVHPRSHGVNRWPWFDDEEPDDGERAFLPRALPTIAEKAQEAGVTTVAVSANPLISRGTNYAKGFETFVEFRGAADHSRWADGADVNAVFLRWLARNRRHRFFGYLHYVDPHVPYTPPEAFRPAPPPGLRPRIASGDIVELGRRINWNGEPPLAQDEVAYLLRLYVAEIRGWDAYLSTLLDHLQGLGVLDSTVLIVTADHGEEFQEHGKVLHGPHLYEETLHVPLIIAGPGVPAGRVDTPVQAIDLFPTIATVLGAGVPPALPGENLLVRLDGRPVFSETARGLAPDGVPAELLSLRTARWHLIEAPTRDLVELYDVGSDPREIDNRAAVAPEAAALRAALGAWRAAAPPPPSGAGRDPHLVEKLRALGYVE